MPTTIANKLGKSAINTIIFAELPTIIKSANAAETKKTTMVPNESSDIAYITGISSQNKGMARSVRNSNKMQQHPKTKTEFVKTRENVVIMLLDAAISRKIVLQKASDKTNINTLTANNTR